MDVLRILGSLGLGFVWFALQPCDIHTAGGVRDESPAVKPECK